MKKVLKYLRPYMIFAILAPLTMIAEVTIDLQMPKYMSTIVNSGVLLSDLNVVVQVGLKMIGLSVLGGLSGILSATFGSIASQRFGNDLRTDTYRRIMSLSPEQTDKFTTGSLVTRITNDVLQVQNFINMLLRMFVRAPMFFVGGIIMMIGLDLQFTTVVAIAFPLLLITVVCTVVKTNPMFKVVQEKLDKVNSVVMENVEGSRVVKAYVREKHEIERFENANNDLCDKNLKVQYTLAIMHPVIMAIMNISVLAIIYIGGFQVEAKELLVGDVMAAVNYVTQILFSVMMITMIFQMISRATASAGRICEVLETNPAIIGGNETLSDDISEIEFRNVCFKYPNTTGKDILSDISLKISKGENVAFLGSTGAGKTTLVSLLARYYDVTGGEILINGKNIKEYTLKSLRDKIGYVLQKSELFSGTVTENIRWGDENAISEQVQQSAKIAQADDFISDFINGYDTIIGEKGASLSGGQKQRVSIARSIMKNPEVLIFDDSTSALDLATEARLHAALRENLSDTTVIMIAQRIASIKKCDRIFVLEDGKIAESGTHSELLENSEVYLDIYNSQLGSDNA